MLSINLSSPQIVTGLVYVCVALFAATLILTVLVVLNAKALARLKERYEAFMRVGDAAGITIEQLIDECLDDIDLFDKSLSALKHRVSSLENQLTGCFQRIGVVRYNPFDDTGGDLSYAIALLDDTNTGFILNGIYSRSGSYTYAKEIENGVSTRHKLSPEEREALQIATGKPVVDRP